MEYSLSHYRDMCAGLRETLSHAANNGTKRVVIYGTSELAEMAYLSLREMHMTLVGFVDDTQQESFLSYPVWPPEALSGMGVRCGIAGGFRAHGGAPYDTRIVPGSR